LKRVAIKNKSFEKKSFPICISIAFGYFLFRLLYFATHISFGVPPDEVTHFGICQVFSKTFLLPENSEETYSLGLVTNVPYLYYFIMGKFLKLNFFPISDLIFLRFLNCLLSFATVVFGYRWMRLITSDRIAQVLFVILITNTPMFSFLGAAVSYDNLTNLFAVTGLYYLHLFLQNPNFNKFLLFGISLLGGALTKPAFLPLVLGYLGILMFHERNYLKSMFPLIKKSLFLLRHGQKLLLGITLILLTFNLTLYLGNLIHFQKVVPNADQVLTEEEAMKSRIYARGRILSLYRSAEVTFEEAMRKAEKIESPGDRADTMILLKIARAGSLKSTPHLDRIQYAWPWMYGMLKRSVGIMGHHSMTKQSYWFSIYQLVFLFAFLLFVRYWKPSESDYRLADAISIVIFYAIILMQFVNYSAYAKSSSISLALQGRYLFPILIPFYGVIAYFLIHPFKVPVRIFILLLISTVFIWGDFPYFLQNATPP